MEDLSCKSFLLDNRMVSLDVSRKNIPNCQLSWQSLEIFA